MSSLRFYVAAALFAVSSMVPAAAATRGVEPEDLFKLKYIDDAQISPDGKYVAMVVAHLDGASDGSVSTIKLVDIATGAIRDATHGKHDGDMAWSGDSARVFFVRRDPKTKHPQIFAYRVNGGVTSRITSVTSGFVNGPVPSHDGTRLAFTVVQTDAPPATHIDFAKAGFKPTAAQKHSDIRSIDQLFFESNGAGFVYDKHPHIWIANADGSHAHALTSGRWGEGNPQWSADDATIAFASLRRDVVDSGVSDVYTMPSHGGDLKKLPSNFPQNGLAMMSLAHPGRFYVTRNVVDDPAAYPEFDEVNFDGSDERTIVPRNTLSWGDALLADMKEGGGPCGGLLPGDRGAVINADGPGYANLRRLDLQTGAVSNLTPPRGEAWACTLSHDGGAVAYLYSDFTHPAELYVAGVATGASRKLTHFNDAWLASVRVSVPQPFTVKNELGQTVYAWFMPAIGGAPGQKHPTLLDIHGGPETQFGDTFFHEFQVWASLGYNVVFSDPRGSVGFGYPFEAALTKHYGDAMFSDVQAVMDAAVTRPDVDAARLGVTGGSYGGYATLWVVGHTNRYKAAAAERVVSDMQSENFGADFASKNGLGGFYSWGKPWDTNSMYREISPITYIENVRTPLLILHAENDTRTPADNTIQWFTLAKILGQKITFIDVPNETHDLSRTGSPIHRVERLHILADWMNSYLLR